MIINKQWVKIFFTNEKTSYLQIRTIIKDLGLDIKFKIINIVGTNGKGSMAHYLSEGLIKNGFKVGTFTSPHLILPTERIKINNQPINSRQFFKIKQQLPKLHFFATIYLVALIYFMQKKIEIAIIEAGIGGNQDITKAIQGKVGVVVSIGLDHQKILGSSLVQIAQDKAGIVNANMHFYIPSVLAKNLQKIFITAAQKSFIVNNKARNFVEQNKILASTILQNEFNIKFLNFSQIPGRAEIRIHGNQKYIFDVAHNLHGMKATLNYLQDQNITFKNVIICMKKSKNIVGVTALFNKKNLFYFQLNNNFHAFHNIRQIAFDHFKKLQGPTLFIGSFQFIGYIYAKNKF